jgi:tetratricopeptide (TPR) repeat protein
VSSASRNTDKWGPSVWDAARDPTLDRYCDLLATGFAQLPYSPDRAIELADKADGVSPGRAGPAILRGRAFSNKKVWDRAREQFDRARAIDPRSLEDPLTMREWARALTRVGRGTEALAVYRTLGPRLSALSSTDDRARTFLEAAELAFSLGPDALDDAIAFLGESKQLAGRDLEWRVGAELALALDRKGAKDEASGPTWHVDGQRARRPSPRRRLWKRKPPSRSSSKPSMGGKRRKLGIATSGGPGITPPSSSTPVSARSRFERAAVNRR